MDAQVPTRPSDTLPERDAPREPQRQRRSVRHYLEAYTFVGLLVAAAIFFSVYPETSATFPSSANIDTLISSNAALAILALAALVPLVTYEFDLSIGAIAGLSSVFVADALIDGRGVAVAILIGVGIGLVVGTINALLITRVGVNAVITTLGTSIIIAGIIFLKTKGTAITGDMPEGFLDFGSETTLGIPRPALALAVATLVVYYVLYHTPYGRYLYAMGSNRSAAKLVGIRNRLVLGLSFVASGGIAGAAGVLLVARAGGADPRVGDTLTLPALAAAFLSAAAIRPGQYNVGGTLVAVYFLAVLNSGLNLAGSPSYVTNFVNGSALIIGVALAVYLGKRKEI